MTTKYAAQRLRDNNCRISAAAHVKRGSDRDVILDQIRAACLDPAYFHQAPHMVTAAREAHLLPGLL